MDENEQPVGSPYEIQYIQLTTDIVKTLEQYPDESYLPYHLLLFSMVYEGDQEESMEPVIRMDQNSLALLYFVIESQKRVYEMLGDENSQQNLEERMAEMQQQYIATHPEVSVQDINFSNLQQGFDKQFVNDITNMKK